MAATLLRNGLRAARRLPIERGLSVRQFRTQNPLTQKYGGGKTFQKAVQENTPKYNYDGQRPTSVKVLILAGIGVSGYLMFSLITNGKSVKAKSVPRGGEKGRPVYRKEEVSKHKTKETGIWVTYNGGVYDITEFVDIHPGGNKILLAAGGALEPFWNMYPVHKTGHVVEWLDSYRIGDMAPDEAKHVDTSDPFCNEPERHPALQVNSAKPFNAETPVELLTDNFVTPNELFFVRNHLPVPIIDSNKYKLTISGLGVKSTQFSLKDLKRRFKKHTVNATMQCAGNRRAEMTALKEVKGLMWKGTAISNAEWSGVLLRDVLQYCGLQDGDTRVTHVQFEGYDKDPAAGANYGASVPSEIALNPHGDVLLAYEMNGEDLPTDHGYPVRVIIPGTVGARNVKWLSNIITSDEESKSHWQQNDYKGFNPTVDWNTINYKDAVPINEAPVTSAICVPKPGQHFDSDDEEVTVKGYAWSGGGRGIIRVDLSLDGGKTWRVATLQQDKNRYNKNWAWTLWEADMKIPAGHRGDLEIISKATDSSYNTQPDSVGGIWNVRGLLNNAWHRVNVVVEDTEQINKYKNPGILNMFGWGWPRHMSKDNFFK